MTNHSTTVADLQLRGRTGTLTARLHWPVDGSVDPTLLVLFPAWAASDVALVEQLCRPRSGLRSGLMVLVARCRTAADAVWTLEWAADHAADIGADGSAVLLVGEGRGADLAIAVARYAAAAGWPAVDLLVLIDPPDGADVRGAHLFDSRGGADVATQVVALLEGATR